MKETLWAFGEFRLHVAARELHRGDRLVELGPRAFDGLVWLLQHADRAVGRDELAAAVWGRANVTDTQIDQLIRKLRRVLGDAGGEQRLIRTVPRFGYRWVAPTHPVEDVDGLTREPPAHAPAPHPDALRRRPPRTVVLASVLVATGLALSGSGDRGGVLRADAPADGTYAVAVMPTRIDEDTDESWRWLRMGLMDLAASRLREAGLRVVPLDNVLALADADGGRIDADGVAAATGARQVIETRIQRTSLGWRLHATLHDGAADERDAEAQAPDPIVATRDAMDRLMFTIGRPLKAPSGDAGMGSPDAWLHRLDAALYARDLDNAQALIDQARDTLSYPDHPELILRQAEVARERGDFEFARERYAAALSSRTPQRLDARSRARALLGLAVTEVKLDNAARGSELLAETVSATEEESLVDLHGMALANIAVLQALRGSSDGATRVFADARAALKMAGDSLTLARVDANQAASLALMHRHAEASLLLDGAIERMRRFGPTDTLASALGNRIHLDLALLQPLHALAVAEQAEDFLDKVGEPRQKAILRLQQIRAFLANGRYAQARAHLAAIEVTVPQSDLDALASSLEEMKARLAWAEGDENAAITLAGEALDAVTPDKPPTLATSQRLSALSLERLRALHRTGRLDEAAGEAKRLAGWAASRSDPLVQLRADVAAAEHSLARGDRARADGLFRKTLESTASIAVADRVDAILAWVGALLDGGAVDEAGRVIARITPWVDQCFECSLAQARLYRELGQWAAESEALRSARRLAGERAIPPAAVAWRAAPLPLQGAAGAPGPD